MVTAGVQETTRLLENKFDYIFFTGTSRGPEQSPAWFLCSEEEGFPLDTLLWLTLPINVRWWAACLQAQGPLPCPRRRQGLCWGSGVSICWRICHQHV